MGEKKLQQVFETEDRRVVYRKLLQEGEGYVCSAFSLQNNKVGTHSH